APLYPTLVDLVSRRRPPLLANVAAAIYSGPSFSGAGMLESVLCDDQIPMETPAVLAQANAGVRPELVHAFQAGFLDLALMACAGWTGPHRRAAPQRVTSDVPTLIPHGQSDPAIPPVYATQIGATLSHSTILDFRGFGHGEIFATAPPGGPPRCAMQVVAAFIANPEGLLDASCVAEIPPPQFLGT